MTGPVVGVYLRLRHAGRSLEELRVEQGAQRLATVLRVCDHVAAALDFAHGHQVLHLGKPGRGKTHIAVAIAYRAIQNGFTARFTGASDLIDALCLASRAGRLREATAAWVEPHVLVIDEVGYLNHAEDAANVLFGVVDQRYLARKPMVFTTNKKLREWGQVLHDRDLAEVILDRVLERGEHIQLGGPSWRTKHLDPETLDDDGADPESVRKVREPGEKP